MFNFNNLNILKKSWQSADPFPHVVIDNFLDENLAQLVADEFPNFNDDFWYDYENPLEIKKACSDWNKFPKNIYSVFFNLLSNDVVSKLSYISDTKLYADYGLHGGGLHCHKSGGKLNAHLDYSIHPKVGLQRKINIILYISKDWNSDWNGSLGLWKHNNETNLPGELIHKIECKFNRALIFDTTMNSWHGLPDPVKCPDNKSRNSLATYYLCDPQFNAPDREKVLYAPTEEQKNDENILKLIELRANKNSYQNAYRVK